MMFTRVEYNGVFMLFQIIVFNVIVNLFLFLLVNKFLTTWSVEFWYFKKLYNFFLAGKILFNNYYFYKTCRFETIVKLISVFG